jgi:hypothetical protein
MLPSSINSRLRQAQSIPFMRQSVDGTTWGRLPRIRKGRQGRASRPCAGRITCQASSLYSGREGLGQPPVHPGTSSSRRAPEPPQGLRHPPAPSPAHGLAFPAERCIAATLRSSPGSRSWRASSESRWANGSIVSLRPTNRTVTCLRSPSNQPNIGNGGMRGAARAGGDQRRAVADAWSRGPQRGPSLAGW